MSIKFADFDKQDGGWLYFVLFLHSFVLLHVATRRHIFTDVNMCMKE